MIKLLNILNEIRVIGAPRIWDLDKLEVNNKEEAKEVYDRIKKGDKIILNDGGKITWTVVTKSDEWGTYPNNLYVSDDKGIGGGGVDFDWFLEYWKLD